MGAKNRRATTETDQKHLAGKNQATDVDPDCDDINFANYKGIYAEEESGDTKYTCPVTGAHFEFRDVCRRLLSVIEKRKPYQETLLTEHSSPSKYTDERSPKKAISKAVSHLPYLTSFQSSKSLKITKG
jgi:hypothetical protein